MSQAIVLACPSVCDPKVIADALERVANDLVATLAVSRNEAQLTDAKGQCYLNFREMADQDGVALDYEANPDLDAAFRDQALGLRFFLIVYNDFAFAKRALQLLLAALAARDMTPWVDTDYGWVIRGDHLLKQMSLDPNWDWRTSPSP